MPKATKQERLRFTSLTYDPRPDGSRHVVVELEWRQVLYRGEAIGTGTLEGDLRASGEATVAAARSATDGGVTVSLSGIKAVRAFDGRVIIAALEVKEGPRQQKLLGAQPLTESDLARGGVLTVLGALNRVLGPHLRRPDEEKPASANPTVPGDTPQQAQPSSTP